MEKKLYIHKASLGKANVLGIKRYSDYSSATIMLDRTREKNIKQKSYVK